MILKDEKKSHSFNELFPIQDVKIREKVNPREIISALSGRDIFSLWKLSASDLYRYGFTILYIASAYMNLFSPSISMQENLKLY